MYHHFQVEEEEKKEIVEEAYYDKLSFLFCLGSRIRYQYLILGAAAIFVVHRPPFLPNPPPLTHLASPLLCCSLLS